MYVLAGACAVHPYESPSQVMIVHHNSTHIIIFEGSFSHINGVWPVFLLKELNLETNYVTNYVMNEKH